MNDIAFDSLAPSSPAPAFDEPLLRDAAERAIRYLRDLDARPVAPSAEAIAGLDGLGGPVPDMGRPARETLRLLDELGSPATVASAASRYFGFVTGGALPVTVAAGWLATAWDQNAGLWLTSPVAAAVEEIALGWLVDVLGLPAGTGGAFVTGASMAGFAALAAARHAVLLRQGWDVEQRGLFGAPGLRVVVGEEAHPTIAKALWLLGFGHANLERVPVDRQGRMRPDALPPLDDRTILCIQAGNVNSGAFDAAEPLCAAARAAGAWVHVDGAFGLWAAASPAHAHLVRGVDLADSWSTDGHKWLNTPYDCGIAFVREPGHLRRAMSVTAPYLPSGARREPNHYTPELSRRARGIEVWAALRTLGRAGIGDLVDRSCAHAAALARALDRGGLEILNDVVLNQLLVAAGDDEATDRLVSAVQRDGTCWCGGTIWHGRRAMRVSLSGWATTEADVALAASAILRCAGLGADSNSRDAR